MYVCIAHTSTNQEGSTERRGEVGLVADGQVSIQLRQPARQPSAELVAISMYDAVIVTQPNGCPPFSAHHPRGP